MSSCWGITSGSAGMAAQVRALAEALGMDPVMKHIVIRKPFVWLPNRCYAGLLAPFVIPSAIARGSDTLSPPWPDLVISCGRRGAIAALGLSHKLKSLGVPTRFIHIQDPHIAPHHFDLVVAMEHDRIRGSNVIKTKYALHTVTKSAMQSAAARFAARFSLYPKPHNAVLLGGSTNRYKLITDDMQEVVASLIRVLSVTEGSLLITPSRRTGENNIALLQEAFAANPRVYLYDFAEENPYMGMLALADTLFVTNDSVNMMSEAYATGKPLYILPLPGHTGTKPARFAERLIKDGIAREFSGSIDSWTHGVDNEMQRLSAEIKRRLTL